MGGIGVGTPSCTDDGTLLPRGGGTESRSGTAVTADTNASATTTACWGQALRSEWASPSETIIDAVTTTPSTPLGETAAATVAGAAAAAAAAVDEKEAVGGGEEAGAEGTGREGRAGARARRRAAGAEVEGGPPLSPRRLPFASQNGRVVEPSSVAAAEAALDKGEEVSKGGGHAKKWQGGCREVPSAWEEASAVAGGIGDDVAPTKTEAVRWGRMDLLSVLYPPPSAGEGRVGASFCGGGSRLSADLLVDYHVLLLYFEVFSAYTRVSPVRGVTQTGT